MSCVVYWLFNDRCVCPWRHGYIGISERLITRLSRHRKANKFSQFNWKVLFQGSRDECLRVEALLRPIWGIGWNNFAGGMAGGTAPKSAEQRAKMSAAAKTRYTNPAERELARQYQVGKHDHRGENNPRFGAVLSENTKQKISKAHVGKAIGNQHWRKRKPYSPEALKKMSEASKRRWENSRRSTKEA